MGVVGIDGDAFDIDVLDVVGPGGVTAGALDDFAAHGGVGSLVADKIHLHKGQSPVRCAADAIAHGQRVALGMQPNRLDAIDGQLDRTARHLGEQRGLGLDREILFATEGTACRDQRHPDLVLGKSQHRRELTQIVVDALPLRIDMEGGGGQPVEIRRTHRNRETALGFHKGVLDKLGAEGLLDHKRARRFGGHYIATGHFRGREQVVGMAIFGMKQRCALGQGRFGTAERREHLVLHSHERGGLTSDLSGLGCHCAQDIADVACLFTHGDKDRPVAVDEPLVARSGYVRSRDHGHDARHSAGGGGIDRQHLGTGMGRQNQGPVEHVWGPEIVEVLELAERHLFAPEARQCGADLAGPIAGGQRLPTQRACGLLDGIDDLDVAGAAAEVTRQGPADLGPRGTGVLVDEVLAAHHHAGDAKPHWTALPSAKAKPRASALASADTFEGEDAATGDFVSREGARGLFVAVDQDHAGPALP